MLITLLIVHLVDRYDVNTLYEKCLHDICVVQSVICAGLYPNVAASLEGVDPGALGGRKPSDILFSKDRPRWYDGRREVHIHPSSVNHSLKAVQYPFLVFLEKVYACFSDIKGIITILFHREVCYAFGMLLFILLLCQLLSMANGLDSRYYLCFQIMHKSGSCIPDP